MNNQNIKNSIVSAFTDAEDVLSTFNKNSDNFEVLNKLAFLIAEIFKTGKKILICGNGGSHCDAQHFAEEFTGRYRDNRDPLPVLVLGVEPGHLTCVANDFGFEQVFARSVEAFGKEGDLLIMLSTSGNSNNLVAALESAKKIGLLTASFLGKSGGKLKNQCNYQLIYPGNTADRVQELHMLSLHVLIEAVERILFPNLY